MTDLSAIGSIGNLYIVPQDVQLYVVAIAAAMFCLVGLFYLFRNDDGIEVIEYD